MSSTADKWASRAWWAAAAVAAWWMVNHLAGVLLPFFVAWLLAYLCYPVVRFAQTRLRIRHRVPAVLLTMLAVLAAVAAVVWVTIPPMVGQAEKAAALLGHWLRQTTHTGDLSAWAAAWVADNKDAIADFFRSRSFADGVKAALPQVSSLLGTAAGAVVGAGAALLTLLYMFFILVDYEEIATKWVGLVPKGRRAFCIELMKDVEREMNNYIRGQSLVSLCLGLLFCIGFTIIDFPMAIGFGILIGVLNLVPYLHTVALVPAVFLSMLKAADTGQNFWVVFGSAMAVFAVVQVISDMVLTPRIMGKAMRLNPAVLLLSLSVWGALLGFIGLIVALPLTTLLIAYWKRYVAERKE